MQRRTPERMKLHAPGGTLPTTVSGLLADRLEDSLRLPHQISPASAEAYRGSGVRKLPLFSLWIEAAQAGYGAGRARIANQIGTRAPFRLDRPSSSQAHRPWCNVYQVSRPA